MVTQYIIISGHPLSTQCLCSRTQDHFMRRANFLLIVLLLLLSSVISRMNFLISIFLLWQGVEDESRKLYGVQFHPEVDLTENGVVMLRNFLYGVNIQCLNLYFFYLGLAGYKAVWSHFLWWDDSVKENLSMVTFLLENDLILTY